MVDKESKCYKNDLILSSKISWEFSRKEEYNSIICR